MSDRLRPEIHDALLRLADGDRSAFDPLFERLWPLLRRLCERLLGGPEDAQDAAQQALLKVFRRASEFDPRRDALSWIFGIAAWECRSLRRRRWRRREELWPPGQLAGRNVVEPAFEQDLIERDLVEGVEEVLGTLGAQDIETIRVALSGAERPPELAAATFRKRLERALRRLRLAWGMKHGGL
jgi:RNA polymerase sigma-70 factor (ECF subfamily)